MLVQFGFIEWTALDIERFYGQRKPLAQRVPLRRASLPTSCSTSALPLECSSQSQAQPPPARARAFSDPPSTPSATEGSTASESEGETETETELLLHRSHTSNGHAVPKPMPMPAVITAPLQLERQHSSSPQSLHDLRNRYFRRDTIVLFHLDIFRCADAQPLVSPKN